jgi:hypothetical protein
MYRFARNEGTDLDELRTRLRLGKAVRSMRHDKSPRQVCVIQLEEARLE